MERVAPIESCGQPSGPRRRTTYWFKSLLRTSGGLSALDPVRCFARIVKLSRSLSSNYGISTLVGLGLGSWTRRRNFTLSAAHGSTQRVLPRAACDVQLKQWASLPLLGRSSSEDGTQNMCVPSLSVCRTLPDHDLSAALGGGILQRLMGLLLSKQDGTRSRRHAPPRWCVSDIETEHVTQPRSDILS